MPQNGLLPFINRNGVVFSAISIGVTLLVYWLTSRSKKNEAFNAVSRDLFHTLSNGLYHRPLDVDVCRDIEMMLPRSKRAGFRKAIEDYKNAQKCTSSFDPVTGATTIDEEIVKHQEPCAKKLLSYLRRR